MYQYTTKDLERFWSKVNKNGSIHPYNSELGHCWEWTRALDINGYGYFSVGGRKGEVFKSHRIAWELINGEIPNDLWVLHSCDRPNCCNPTHLFLGTQQDNVNDMMAKKRNSPPPHPKGELNGFSKLTQQQVDEIRERYAQGGISYQKLADIYNVSDGHIHRIIRRISWS